MLSALSSSPSGRAAVVLAGTNSWQVDVDQQVLLVEAVRLTSLGLLLMRAPLFCGECQRSGLESLLLFLFSRGICRIGDLRGSCSRLTTSTSS